MKKIILFLLLSVSLCSAQEHRVSHSTKKQPSFEKMQGGVLVRINHIKLDSSWQCDEFFVEKNTKAKDVRKQIKAEFPSAKLTAIIARYEKDVSVDTTVAGQLQGYKYQQQLNRKLIETIKQLDRRLRKLEAQKKIAR